MQEYDKAVGIIAKKSHRAYFAGKKTESLVEMAEKTLGVKFPPTYRRFLLEFGAGNFGSSEIYGVIDDNFKKSSVPDAIWYTLVERKEVKLPSNLVVIYDTGDGELFCIDLGVVDNQGESPIITFQPGYSLNEQRREIIANDFGEFFLKLVEKEADG